MPTLNGKGTMSLVKDGPIWQAETGPLMRLLKPITHLEPGVWDLPLTGPERIDVERAYQNLAGGPDYTMVSLDGALVASSAGELYQLLAHFSDNEHFDKQKLRAPYEHAENFYPSGSLPDDCVFVVRTAALSELLTSLASTERARADAKPLTTTERNTLLTIIGVLADAANFDVTAPSKSAEAIVNAAALSGITLSRTGVANHLRAVVVATGTRKK